MQACHRQKKNLVLYVHGELDSNSGNEIENHLEKCDVCRSEYHQLLSLLGNIRETAAPPELSAKQINSLVTNIQLKLKDRKNDKWWRAHDTGHCDGLYFNCDGGYYRVCKNQ